jgi:hypothetical protein
MSQISKQHEISNECPHQHFVQPAERRSTAVGFVLVRLSCQSNKHQSNSRHTGKLIRNATQDCVYPLEIPFRYDVRRGGVRVRRNIVVRVSLELRVEAH